MGKDVPGDLQSILSALGAAAGFPDCVAWLLSCEMGTTSCLWGADLGQGQMGWWSPLVWRVKSWSCPWEAHPVQSCTFLQDLLPAFQEPWETQILQERSEGWRDPTPAALGLFVGSPCDRDKAELRNSMSIPREMFSEAQTDLKTLPGSSLCHLAPGQHSPAVPTFAEIGNFSNFSPLFKSEFLLKTVVSPGANLTQIPKSPHLVPQIPQGF